MKHSIKLDTEQLEHVSKFKYLVSRPTYNIP